MLRCHSNSYPTQAAGGGGGRRQNPYAQQDDTAYEMSSVKNSATNLGAPGGNDMSAFYTEVRFAFHRDSATWANE